jgi:amino acid transporter
MAQHSLNYEADADRKGLGYEKLGVIAGFLVGLPVGVGLVDAPLTAVGAPQWVGIVATVAVVAVCTALGLRGGAALAKRATQG